MSADFAVDTADDVVAEEVALVVVDSVCWWD